MKAVIFDFDGTLTQKNGNLWKKIWQELGYDIGPDSYYVGLFKKFIGGEITHREWCDLTLEAFKERGFCKEQLDNITDNMSLIQGADSLIKYLYSKNIELHIVSGNIVSVIEKVLGENRKYISSIKANEFVFDNNGIISQIVGTKYDFEGKAKYIKELCQTKEYDPSDLLFIGNSMNDEWVYRSGVKTLCVNPDNTKTDNSQIWNKVINTDDLSELSSEII